MKIQVSDIDSSVIGEITFRSDNKDPDRGVLDITFKSGVKYQYKAVDFRDLLKMIIPNSSVGHEFHKNINGKYEYKKLSGEKKAPLRSKKKIVKKTKTKKVGK
jgi:hypothetical protein